MIATIQHADIKVESANAYFLQRRRQFIAWFVHGHGHAVGALESLAALARAQSKYGPTVSVRPIGNSLYVVKFEKEQAA